MLRQSIYISSNLHDKMQSIGSALNWSDIASQAFLSAIANYEARQKQLDKFAEAFANGLKEEEELV